MSFLKLKLTAKLVIGFIVVAFITMIVGFFGYYGISIIGKDLEEIANYRMPSLSPLFVISGSLDEIKAAERTLLVKTILGNDHDIQYEVIPNALNRLDSARKSFSKFIQTKKEDSLWQNFQKECDILIKGHNDFLNISKEYDAAIRKDITAGTTMYDAVLRNTVMMDLADQQIIVSDILKELMKVNQEETEVKKEEANSASSYSLGLILIITFIAVSAAIFIGLYLSLKIIKKPIVNLIDRFNQVFDVIIENKDEKDQIVVLSEMVEKISGNQKQLAIDLLNRTEAISKSSTNLFNLSEQASTFSEKLYILVSEAAQSSDLIFSNMNSVSTSSEEMGASIKEISKNTSSASKITDLAREKANSASEVVSELGKSSNEIGNILKVISGIAGQTNLLALNATIEAARAGELGKGFAVVANEVKELAKESAKSTETISEIIKVIQNNSNNAIEVIREIVETTSQIGDMTNSVASAIEEQSVTVDEVNRNLSEASEGTKSINDTVGNVSSAIEDFLKLAKQLHNTSEELQQLSKETEHNIRTNFKL